MQILGRKFGKHARRAKAVANLTAINQLRRAEGKPPLSAADAAMSCQVAMLILKARENPAFIATASSEYAALSPAARKVWLAYEGAERAEREEKAGTS